MLDDAAGPGNARRVGSRRGTARRGRGRGRGVPSGGDGVGNGNGGGGSSDALDRTADALPAGTPDRLRSN
eukprot:3457993-Alexandrium_andersonii.AAC.1